MPMRSIVMGEEIYTHAAIIRAGRVLLLRRSELNKRGHGDWEFPGGKIDFGAGDLASELRREVREETGYELHLGRVLGHQTANTIIRRKRKPTPLMSLCWVARIASGKLELSYEHDASTWCSMSEAKALTLSTRTKNALTKYRSILKDEYKFQI